MNIYILFSPVAMKTDNLYSNMSSWRVVSYHNLLKIILFLLILNFIVIISYTALSLDRRHLLIVLISLHVSSRTPWAWGFCICLHCFSWKTDNFCKRELSCVYLLSALTICILLILQRGFWRIHFCLQHVATQISSNLYTYIRSTQTWTH